jgi:hypothetical protein
MTPAELQAQIRPGDKVFCVMGSRSGHGVVREVREAGIVVSFPHQTYPLSLVVITGEYFIPCACVIKRE